MRRKFRKAYFKLLRLVLYSKDTPHKIAMGGAVGLFWGLTPTVGLQMSVLTLSASLIFFLKKISRRFVIFDFHFALAIMFTWISNPLDAPLLYFLFYWAGVMMTPGLEMKSFDEFIEMLKPLLNVDSVYTWSAAKEYGSLVAKVFSEIGIDVLLPMCYGCLAYAIPGAFGAYFGIRMLIARSKRKRELKKIKRHEAKVLPTQPE